MQAILQKERSIMLLNDKRLWATSLLLIALLGVSVLSIGCASKTEQTTSAAFAVNNLSVEPLEVMAGEEGTVAAEVNNTGGSEGSYTAELKVNGVTEDTRNINLPAGASLEVTFNISKDNPGAYEVTLGGLTGQFVVTETAAQDIRSATWSDAVVTQLLFEEMPEITVRMRPGNKAEIDGAPIPMTVSIGVSEGKIYFDRVSSMAYDFIASGHPVVESCTEYDGGKIWLMSLPPRVDPSEVFAPDVDRLPFVESVTTGQGEVTLTYRWP